MNEVSNNKIWCTGAVKFHADSPTIDLIKSDIDLKIE